MEMKWEWNKMKWNENENEMKWKWNGNEIKWNEIKWNETKWNVFLRNLPEVVKNYIFHHSSADTVVSVAVRGCCVPQCWKISPDLVF